VSDREKTCLGPQNGLRSLETEKVLKIVSCQRTVLSQLDKVGGHQDPPGSLSQWRGRFKSKVIMKSEEYEELDVQ
jgi:hypothetical protein